MTTTSTIAALQTLHAAVTGVATAPAAYPNSLEVSETPCVLTYAGPATTRWDAHGGMPRTERTYIARWYVWAVPLGAGVDEGMQEAITMLDRALALYRVTDDLSNGAQIRIADDDRQAIRDSGVRSDLTYGEMVFRGFEVQLSIWEWL